VTSSSSNLEGIDPGEREQRDAGVPESAGDIAWLRHEFLVGSRELTRSARERGLLARTQCERAVMFTSKRFRKPFREAIGEQRDEPADE
jgi:hypothetical protein